MVGSRVHDERDERLAGAEDEDGEQDPGRDVGLLFLMDMGVIGFVDMLMLVRGTVGMHMDVLVRSVLYGPVQPPDKVGKTETDQKPCRHSAAEGFDVLQFQNGHSQGYSGKTKHDRAEDVPQAAEKRDKQSFGKGPITGPAHDDEGEIMVRPQNRMDKTQGNCRSGDDKYMIAQHHAFPWRMMDGMELEHTASALRTPRSST